MKDVVTFDIFGQSLSSPFDERDPTTTRRHRYLRMLSVFFSSGKKKRIVLLYKQIPCQGEQDRKMCLCETVAYISKLKQTGRGH